ncbi:hypothetical protein IE53DRAFT_385909 [Violaceomyces palustris]|uniref:Uncharacterized protein n=1 Tax=Violaceomyces palustris TaxID=1673888 RepID=A0ACD0P0Q1_9BASI|nr:hypothetical protein IE53DRAFT_385909 [Violaceomyces palustris]
MLTRGTSGRGLADQSQRRTLSSSDVVRRDGDGGDVAPKDETDSVTESTASPDTNSSILEERSTSSREVGARSSTGSTNPTTSNDDTPSADPITANPSSGSSDSFSKSSELMDSDFNPQLEGSSSSASSTATAAAETPSSQNQTKKKSIWDELFSGDEPFPQTEGAKSRGGSAKWLSEKLYPTSASRDRERPFALRGREREAQGGRRGDQDRYALSSSSWKKKAYSNKPLTEKESELFAKIFDAVIYGSEGGVNDKASTTASEATGRPLSKQEFGAFSSFGSHTSPKDKSRNLLEVFASRNKLTPWQRSRLQPRGGGSRYVREGLAAQISTEEMDEGVDRAREELVMCENEFEVWEWAKREVWGIQHHGDDHPSKVARMFSPAQVREEIEGRATKTEVGEGQERKDGVAGPDEGEEGAEAGVSENPEDSSPRDPSESPPPLTSQADQVEDGSKSKKSQSPRFGMRTPFYPVVLQLLFTTLRDRYNSPHSALAVLPITKSLGVESYVLGCTAQLYVEILKTRWQWMGDVKGCRDAVKQARESGVLGDPASLKRSSTDSLDDLFQKPGLSPSSSSSSSSSSLKNEDEPIRETVEKIREECRRSIIADASRITSLQYEIKREAWLETRREREKERCEIQCEGEEAATQGSTAEVGKLSQPTFFQEGAEVEDQVPRANLSSEEERQVGASSSSGKDHTAPLDAESQKEQISNESPETDKVKEVETSTSTALEGEEQVQEVGRRYEGTEEVVPSAVEEEQVEIETIEKRESGEVDPEPPLQAEPGEEEEGLKGDKEEDFFLSSWSTPTEKAGEMASLDDVDLEPEPEMGPIRFTRAQQDILRMVDEMGRLAGKPLRMLREGHPSSRNPSSFRSKYSVGHEGKRGGSRGGRPKGGGDSPYKDLRERIRSVKYE